MLKYLFISLILFASCNSAKKVLSNQKEFQKVGEAWAKQNPCANDTTVVFRPGRVDTLKLSAPTFDIKHAADSIAQALANKYRQKLQECDQQVHDAYTAGYLQSSADWTKNPMVIKQHDSTVVYVKDTRAENILKGQLSDAQKDIMDSMKEADEYRKQRNNSRTTLLLLVMIAGTIIYFKVIK